MYIYFLKKLKKNSFTLMTFLSNYIDIMTAYKCQMKFKLFLNDLCNCQNENV